MLDLLTIPDAGLDQAALLAYADRAEATLDETATKPERSLPAYARGRAHLDAGRVDEAVGSFRESLRRWPSHQNRAVLGLLRCYAETGRQAEFIEATDRYLKGRNVPPAVVAEYEGLKAKVLGR